MIDIHCHILPDIDDGPSSIEGSLDMAKKAVEQGITTIVATPHCSGLEARKSSISEQVEQLNAVLEANDIPLKILPGQEIAITDVTGEELSSKTLQTLGDTRYVLIELPSDHIPSFTDQLIFNLLSDRYVPVIAHPERNIQILENPNELHRFVSKGALVQLTAGSVTGQFGKQLQELSVDFIDANLVHFIASDASAATDRGFYLQEAYEVVGETFGDVCVDYFKENAALLVKDAEISIWKPEEIQKKKKTFFESILEKKTVLLFLSLAVVFIVFAYTGNKHNVDPSDYKVPDVAEAPIEEVESVEETAVEEEPAEVLAITFDSDYIYVEQNSSAYDLKVGMTVHDDNDSEEDLAKNVTMTADPIFDVSKVGVYEIVYEVTNSVGETATAMRTVEVVPEGTELPDSES